MSQPGRTTHTILLLGLLLIVGGGIWLFSSRRVIVSINTQPLQATAEPTVTPTAGSIDDAIIDSEPTRVRLNAAPANDTGGRSHYTLYWWPASGAIGYRIEVNGQVVQDVDGKYTQGFDLGVLDPNGVYTIRIGAIEENNIIYWSKEITVVHPKDVFLEGEP